jgi:hypothetical protein
MMTAGSNGPAGGSTAKVAGWLKTGIFRPETNGVRIGPSRPVTPASPMSARIPLTASARNGPMNGIASRIGVAARPMAASMAAVAAPNFRFGRLWTTASTFHTPPTCVTARPKSAVACTKSANDTGIVMVGQSMQIFGVHTVPTQGMWMQTRGMQKSGRMSDRSNWNDNEMLQSTRKSVIRIVPGGIRSASPPLNVAFALYPAVNGPRLPEPLLDSGGMSASAWSNRSATPEAAAGRCSTPRGAP